MKNKITQKLGFTLVEIMIVVAIIGLLAAIAVPNFVKARLSAQQNACLNNLRQLDGAVQQWALDLRAKPTENVTVADITSYLKAGANIVCPAGGSGNLTTESCYYISSVDVRPTCKIQSAGVNNNYLHKLPE